MSDLRDRLMIKSGVDAGQPHPNQSEDNHHERQPPTPSLFDSLFHIFTFFHFNGSQCSTRLVDGPL
ncbi:putative uncharacterized protein [Lactiplantibacillus plantarum]|nr:putative uncharacterized protein [Lactiplantibacillus plantarum]